MNASNRTDLDAAALDCLRSRFGLDLLTDVGELLAGGLSGDRTYAVRCRQGRFVVKHWQPEDTGYARRSAVLQEALRAAGAPLPAHIRTRGGHLVVRDTTVREFASGRVLSSWSSGQVEVFGQALGRLYRALADCPVDSFYLDQPSVFSRCKDIEQVAGRYLPACDGRFPSGYRGHLVATLERLTSRLSEIADQPRILTHVDPNPENAIFGEAGQVTLIDLTPEVRPPGYSLGAALYSWAYP
ncbi:MAG: phosphotransferase enzyme family protein, partial [Methylocella sp.]